MSLSGGITNQKPVVIAVAWLLFFGGLAGLSYWNDHRIAAEPDILAQRDVRQIGLAIEKPIPKYETKQIGEIRPIVDWVLAANPEMTVDRDYVDETGRYITDFGPLGPPDWRVVHFRLWKETGGDLNIWLGRPLWYWEELGATSVGQTVWLNFEEFGAVGNAEVISINQCLQPPPRPTDRHFLVTGRFEHSSVDFLRLLIAGVAEPLDTTANHPFWSDDRHAFVPAGELRDGEVFRLADGSSTHLVSASRNGTPKAAYNIEVDGQHVFCVSSAGVLVHNACAIALGKDIPGGGYKALASQTGASRWQNWAKDGITRRSVTNHFGRAFHEAANRASIIHFSLDGIDDVNAAVKAGRKGFINGNMTNAELEYIFSEADLLKKTVFYRNGQIVPSPF